MRNLPLNTLLCTLIACTGLILDDSIALEYTEYSGGLGFPQWEGGRSEIEMADIDQDGNIDLISIGDHGSPYINTDEHGIMVYFGDGDGRWQVYMNGNFGYGGICVGDVNDDGHQDVGYAMHHNYSGNDFGDQLIEVAIGDGTGQNWTPWDDGLASQGEDYGMFATDFGDVDNDGDLDIAATSFGSGNPLQIYLNNEDGTWTHSQAVTPGPNCGMHVFFGDINKDGNLDIATAYQSGTVFFGYGNGQFYPADYNLPSGGTLGHTGPSMGDVDNDGGMDLAFTSSGAVKVWVFDESSTQWVDYTGNLPTTGGYGMTQLCDMNADGYCDVAAGGDGRVTVWTGDGTGNWTGAATYIIENDPDCDFEAFRVGGDADHNGYPDIVHLTDEGGWISSYNHLRFYKETSVATALSIKPMYPKGGELFKSGSVRFIDYLTALPDTGVVTDVKIELSTTGATGPWTVIADDLPANGRHQWTVSEVETSTDCYLRLTVFHGWAFADVITSAPFTIINGVPDVQVTLEPVNPPIVIPAVGGSFDYTIGLVNNEAVPIGCSVWIDVTLPNSSIFGPVINVSLAAPTGAISRVKTQAVPANAPSGDYSYNAYVGIYPSDVWSSESFGFSKSATDFGGGSYTQWWTNFDGFEEEIVGLSTPSSYDLVQVYPNPFNPTAVISFELRVASWVELNVFDINGRTVPVGARHASPMINSWRDAGAHEVTFDGSNLASGIYIYTLTAGDYTATGKMVLMK
ncbi:hypothetical protein CEE37_00055 [candidate division LCP-89 bacterium B3_LCP]|uniref:Secretion system C-terminal sorting domain-containing protein n=1 Tax=candidate division LCP-89 bacterium B3_LCP TaxID=2012998 RepID=A0A532V4H2_UNCL8|nr:MAG: hypothetical protein CEE37_00055 [candidate division LCP-89 bacterium B3_LCP]